MFRYLYSSLLLTLLSISSFAGSIKGTVTDSKTNAILSGVVVSLPGTSNGAVTDFDGKYELNGLANGAYEIVFTYATYLTYRQSITIARDEDLVLDMKLMPETTELKGSTIKSGRITNTETSVISEIKNSSNVVSGTSAAQISKTMDRNAAEVVKRIPGVTIQDDRFIVIRGLPDRYNTVWLNDASTPSSEADKRAFSFDIIPAGLIDRILVFKTPSPELPGDFAGGMVKVYTTSIAERNSLTVNLQTSSREYTTGASFNYSPSSKTDWLGYDDGQRSIPSVIPEKIPGSNDPRYKDNIAAWSKSFGNDWKINTKDARPDLRFSLALTNVIKLKKIKIGNTLGIAYTNANTTFSIQRQDWDSNSKSYNYIDRRSSNNVNAGVMDNIGVMVGNSKFEFKNLYNQSGSSVVTLRNFVPDSLTGAVTPNKAYMLYYESRATYASQLTGTHKNDADTRKYTWTLGYTDLFRNQPNRRIIRYSQVKPDSNAYSVALPGGAPDILNGGRFYSTLFEHTYSFNHNFSQKFNVKDHQLELSAGNYLEYKSRSFNIREFGYVAKRNATTMPILALPYDQIFADSNVDGTTKIRIGEGTHDYDHYSAENKLYAGYLSAKIPVGDFSLSGGVRYEHNIQSLNAIFGDTLTPSATTKFLLPSANASYNFSEKTLVRVAYGKTLNRPEFREWAPIFYYDFDEVVGYKGSLFPTLANRNKGGKIGDTLKVAEIQNFDIRGEFYPATGEMIQVGGFYKRFTNPIQKVLIPSSAFGDNRTFTFINADNAYCYGVEVDIRKNLEWLDRKLNTGIFRDITLVGNFTWAKSEVTIDTSKDKGVFGIIHKSTLAGQAPYIINAGIFYQNNDNDIQGSLLYNIAGPRLYALGNTDAGSESLGEMPFRSMDAVISKTIKKHYVISFGAQNILGGRVMFMKDVNRDVKFDTKNDRDFRTYYPGRVYTIGVKIKF
ncbi:MAG: TonB-dependent receptor [Bacteroidota bacterium]